MLRRWKRGSNMSTTLPTQTDPVRLPSEVGDPTWEVSRLFPRQGTWTEADFRALDASCLVELNNGVLEFLDVPSLAHQLIQKRLSRRLDDFVTQHRLGEVFNAPTAIRLPDGQLREPDVVYLATARLPSNLEAIPDGADVAIEIVSLTAKSRRHDLVTKRTEYAQAGIPEYWIVDPETETIIVLTLPANATEYAVHGEFKPGQTATSKLLDGFTVDVSACFAAGKGAPE
jgi:Uma2 family endonuclease